MNEMFCILVSGVPASGKTRFASFLSKKLAMPMMSKDIIKEKLFDTVGFNSRDEKVKLGVGSMEILYYFAEQMMCIGKPFILENNFENASVKGIEELLNKYNYTPVNVCLTGDLEAIYARFAERETSPFRHRGHVVNTNYPEVETEKQQVPCVSFHDFVTGVKERGMADFCIGDIIIDVDVTDFSSINYELIVNEIQGILKHI